MILGNIRFDNQQPWPESKVCCDVSFLFLVLLRVRRVRYRSTGQPNILTITTNSSVQSSVILLEDACITA